MKTLLCFRKPKPVEESQMEAEVPREGRASALPPDVDSQFDARSVRSFATEDLQVMRELLHGDQSRYK